MEEGIQEGGNEGVVDNAPQLTGGLQAQPEGNWRDSLSDPDLRNNPTLGKYKSQEEAHRGHLKLQESFGMDKVVWPKDENDTERWAEVNKRLGVPESAEGYNLEALANPEGVQLFDRADFQQKMKEAGATQKVAQNLWRVYTDQMKSAYTEANEQFQANLNNNKAALMAKYGEAYESKIQNIQRLIDTFATTEDQKNFMTSQITQDPMGSEFMIGIAEQFVESSIAGFQHKETFTLSPQEARDQLAALKAGPDYNSDNERIRQPAIDRANELMRMANPGM
jgi:hypothetical protein